MPITQAEAQATTLAFTRDYPGALELLYYFREDVEKLYGPRAAEVSSSIKGGYLSKDHTHNGRLYRGRVDAPLGQMNDAADLLVTLRHEVLGHYGANTFKPAEKRALLDGLIASREEPSLQPRWEDINRRYAEASLDVRAEEVWALHCETLAPGQHVGQAQVRERGAQSFMETCIARVRPMQVGDLHNIACMVADGLHDRSRTQQTFPRINELFRRDEAMEPKKPFAAEKLIEQLKAGTALWQWPWEPGEPNAYLPMSPTTTGALWDKAAKSRYAGPRADMAKLEQCKPGHKAQRVPQRVRIAGAEPAPYDSRPRSMITPKSWAPITAPGLRNCNRTQDTANSLRISRANSSASFSINRVCALAANSRTRSATAA